MQFLSRLQSYQNQGILTVRQGEILRQFHTSYVQAFRDKGVQLEDSPPVALQFLEMVVKEVREPHPFGFYYEKTTAPDDYYQFGLDLVGPLVDHQRSILLGQEQFLRIEEQLARGENAVFFANHQTEPDPQAMSLLLGKHTPDYFPETIFVAGDRVIADPIAVPFSKGRNMLCIYSKKHMTGGPDERLQKQQHNRKAMHALTQKLTEGGHCIYVAPSGGRDRPSSDGTVDVAAFDPNAIDLFLLLAKQAGNRTHFYPLSLVTHDLLPPPPVLEEEIGEDRVFHYTPIGMKLGLELDLAQAPRPDGTNKQEARRLRSEWIHSQVREGYWEVIKEMKARKQTTVDA